MTEKNNFCVVTGDGSSLGSLEDKDAPYLGYRSGSRRDRRRQIPA